MGTVMGMDVGERMGIGRQAKRSGRAVVGIPLKGSKRPAVPRCGTLLWVICPFVFPILVCLDSVFVLSATAWILGLRR